MGRGRAVSGRPAQTPPSHGEALVIVLSAAALAQRPRRHRNSELSRYPRNRRVRSPRSTSVRSSAGSPPSRAAARRTWRSTSSWRSAAEVTTCRGTSGESSCTSSVGNRLGNNVPAEAAQTRSNRAKRPVVAGSARLWRALGAGGRKPLGVRVPPPAWKVLQTGGLASS
jgi:hypothetical protein